jgi:hypothetical protein
LAKSGHPVCGPFLSFFMFWAFFHSLLNPSGAAITSDGGQVTLVLTIVCSNQLLF